MNTDRIRWGVPRDAGLRWRRWDGAEVLYHGASGDTHHLSAVAAAALRFLELRPSTAAELTGHLRSTLGAPPDEAFARDVEAMLARLDELGLVEAAP